MADLVLNVFEVDLSPRAVNLPVFYYTSWDDSKRGVVEQLHGCTVHRAWERPDPGSPGGRVMAVAIYSPIPPDRPDEVRRFEFAQHSTLAGKIIERSLAEYLRERGYAITRSSFETRAMSQSPIQSLNGIELRTGISFIARRPFKAEPNRFVLCATWDVSASFAISLLDPRMRPIAKGMAAIFNPASAVPTELEQFKTRYIGVVREIVENDALVACRDGVTRRVRLAHLFAEARPDSIRRYETKLGLRSEARSLWRTIQRLNFILTKEGRRNISVHQDRLHAVRELLGAHSGRRISMPFHALDSGFLSIDLTPMRVEVQ